MSTLITYEVKEDYIAVITLNRPNVLNALSKKLLDELNKVIKEIKRSNMIRVVILTGAEERAFCAGADLKERIGMSDDEVVRAVQYIGKTISHIEAIPVPVIAALNGAAFGGGLELALACDIRIASDTVKVGLTETSLAIIPGAGGTQRLPRLIGIGQAKRLIYTANPIDANEAYNLGIFEQLVKPDALYVEAEEMARMIAKNGPIAIRKAKIAINNGMQTDLHTALHIEHVNYEATIKTSDRLEGLRAFNGKRKPLYKGE